MGLSARWTEEKTRKELAAVAAVAVSVDVGESIKVLLVCGTPQAHHIIIHTFTCSVPSLFFLFFYPSVSFHSLISAHSHSDVRGVVCIQDDRRHL